MFFFLDIILFCILFFLVGIIWLFKFIICVVFGFSGEGIWFNFLFIVEFLVERVDELKLFWIVGKFMIFEFMLDGEFCIVMIEEELKFVWDLVFNGILFFVGICDKDLILLDDFVFGSFIFNVVVVFCCMELEFVVKFWWNFGKFIIILMLLLKGL